MLEQVKRIVHHDCQDEQKLIAAYKDIGVGPAVIFDGAGFTDPDHLRAFAEDLVEMSIWLAAERSGAIPADQPMETRIDEWSTPAEIRRASFDQWAAKNEIPERTQLNVLHDAVDGLSAEVERLRVWIDTEGRNCPSAATVDAALQSPSSQQPKETT